MQVVVPSVSLAAVAQGTASTILVDIPSSATSSKPVLFPGNSELPAMSVGSVGSTGVAGRE
jgi:hypothetical protein